MIVEHARALTQTERAVRFWDQPEYLQTVENIVNRYSDWETGLSQSEYLLTIFSTVCRYSGWSQNLTALSVWVRAL
jgi:hypothetical protein